MQVGLIGCGKWGKNIARNLSELDCLAAICDSRQSVREFAQSRYSDILVSGDWEDTLATTEMDAVCIATNAASHHAIAKAALKAGKDVFVEKPLATAVPDAKELGILAEENGLVLMVGHLLRYTQAAREMKDLMVGLGKPLYVHAQRMGFADPQTDVGVIWDLAVHEMSILVWLLGMPRRVKAYGHDFSHNGVKDFASIKLQFPRDVSAHIDVTWWYPQKVRRLVIAGEKAMAVWDDMQGEYKIELHQKWIDQGIKAHSGRVAKISVPACEPLRAELQHFLDCCETRKEPLTGPKEALKVTEILAAAERSLYRQEWQVI